MFLNEKNEICSNEENITNIICITYQDRNYMEHRN